MTDLAALDATAVLAAVSPAEANNRTRLVFARHANREWEIPAKVYLEAPPNRDFTPCSRGADGFALLKWVTSFPRNPERWLPVIAGALLFSRAETGELANGMGEGIFSAAERAPLDDVLVAPPAGPRPKRSPFRLHRARDPGSGDRLSVYVAWRRGEV